MSHIENKKVMDALAQCAAECNHCATACLDEKDIMMLTRCIRLDIDCAEICSLAGGFVARGSESYKRVLKLCAEICEACAKECDTHTHMEHCSRCARACRDCADSCKNAA
ncbi:MAG TPA: four-helix bundle copper-binding protein [Bacteroidia bacterium]|nr:four-helix bundle copper-binding protein [Bacteroidia bacterium]